jgi:hypothetical protein
MKFRDAASELCWGDEAVDDRASGLGRWEVGLHPTGDVDMLLAREPAGPGPPTVFGTM